MEELTRHGVFVLWISFDERTKRPPKVVRCLYGVCVVHLLFSWFLYELKASREVSSCIDNCT